MDMSGYLPPAWRGQGTFPGSEDRSTERLVKELPAYNEATINNCVHVHDGPVNTRHWTLEAHVYMKEAACNDTCSHEPAIILVCFGKTNPVGSYLSHWLEQKNLTIINSNTPASLLFVLYTFTLLLTSSL